MEGKCDVCHVSEDLNWSGPRGMKVCRTCANAFTPLLIFIENTKMENFELQERVTSLEKELEQLVSRLKFVTFKD